MTQIPTSVVIVSRGRPAALQRCLEGIEQLAFQNFEVILVADPAGCASAGEMGFEALKILEFDEPNISAARNIGLTQAAGDVVAFVDDDAVPEPTWLDFLVAPFKDPSVSAVGGFVRGRNGISFQSKAAWVDGTGKETAIETGDEVMLLSATPGKAIKTEGTNCAFRREALVDLGGFDTAFRFYLDETDVNLRLAEIGATTAIVPRAQVHHGFLPSAQRKMSRVPKTLFDVGASQAIFLRKHFAGQDHRPLLAEFQANQRNRMIRHMVAGNCEPRDVARVLGTLKTGIDDGQTRAFGQAATIASSSRSFLKFNPRRVFSASIWLSDRAWRRRRLLKMAQEKQAIGHRVSVFLYSPTALYHSVEFRGGVWIQRGGLFGKSNRSDPLFKFWPVRKRERREAHRVAKLRGLSL